MSRSVLCRAYLAVPAHRPGMVAKAASSDADAVFLDLEDAVPSAEKSAALAGAIEALETLEWGIKLVSVRLGGPNSRHYRDEVAALSRCARLDSVIMPKVEHVADVAELGDMLRHLSGARAAPIDIELLIESARGLMLVEQLAGAHSLVTALHLGVGDFAASIGARTADIGVSPTGYAMVADGRETPLDLYAYPMMRLLVTARAYGLRAIDGPYGAFADEAATGASARRAAAMGFDGKQVIHPRQIHPTIDAFRPTEAEIAYARHIEAALTLAESGGSGAAVVDGKMVDAVSLRLIQRAIDR